jgi:phosphopantothenoylcysteine decarboxylase/phosphopantothenate--cysteine ligase
MSFLHDKRILLGVSGSIAAYKIPILARLLVKAGAEVQVIMTESSKGFVTPLTLSTITERNVLSSFIDEKDENAVWNNHVSLALWADLMLIAPASANTISKMATAAADNLLMAIYLSSKCPVFFAPAMDLDMHEHLANKKNIDQIVANGNTLIPATSGPLASGLNGKGRMQEPQKIIQILEDYFKLKSPLSQKKILITAGPTYEPIDPVRFIGNHSSGKMGYAIANAAADLGAEVTLISGPTSGNKIHPRILLKNVTTASQMLDACLTSINDSDALIMAAAVADFKAVKHSKTKLKKEQGFDCLAFEPTVDILKTLSERKSNQIIIGFALESTKGLENAKLKLSKKNLDAIVVNSLSDQGAGFGFDTNKISFLQAGKLDVHYPLKSKQLVAKDILNHLKNMFDES